MSFVAEESSTEKVHALTVDRDNSIFKNLVVRSKTENDDTRKSVLPVELTPEYLDLTMKKRLRWVMLLLCCSFVVGNYFCYDYPALLKDQLESELGISS